LGGTLEAYLEGVPTEIPFWRHALAVEEVLAARCDRLAETVGGTVEMGVSAVGAGSAPGISIPSPVVRMPSRQDLFECLLHGDRPVLTRRDAGDLFIDLRAVETEDDDAVIAAIAACQ
jgi:hypothetical protein